jgi:serine/threonine protein kinase
MLIQSVESVFPKAINRERASIMAESKLLHGYYRQHVLLTGRKTTLYIATRESDNEPVIIKMLNSPNPMPEDIQELYRESEILRGLENAHIITCFGLERAGSHHAIILEHFRGVPLSRIALDMRKEQARFLQIALQAVDALVYLHGRRIVHKAIGPGTILVNKAHGSIKLIGFGKAGELAQEYCRVCNPITLEESLSCIAPEQTGYLRRAIDCRTDLYSLGATLYRLACGVPLFLSNDAAELVYKHIAVVPQSPHEKAPGLSPVLSDIIMKLLAKLPEDRYQTALGLKYDLERCQNELPDTKAIAAFTIGQKDIGAPLRVSCKLYGREAEIGMLSDAFHRVCGGGREMLLISGNQGSGKTTLAHEVLKPLVSRHGYFGAGAFEQFHRCVPFSAISRALGDLIGLPLAESTLCAELWKNRLLEALGSNGQTIIDIVPEVELIIGKQPPELLIASTERKNRFHYVS